MNRIQIVRSTLVAVTGLVLVSGCSSAGPNSGASATALSGDRSDNGFVPPFRGETQGQVLAQYDHPTQAFESESGQTWVYFVGNAKQYIPFYGPWAERRVLVIHFDPYGRVTAWESRSSRPD
jgi:hypothetical protein